MMTWKQVFENCITSSYQWNTGLLLEKKVPHFHFDVIRGCLIYGGLGMCEGIFMAPQSVI